MATEFNLKVSFSFATDASKMVLEHVCVWFNFYSRCYFYSVIEQLGGKQLVMQLLGHDDPNVRYEALIAVQKLMVHNWCVLTSLLIILSCFDKCLS